MAFLATAALRTEPPRRDKPVELLSAHAPLDARSADPVVDVGNVAPAVVGENTVEPSDTPRASRAPAVDTIVVAGVIHSNLYDALDHAADSLPRGSRAKLAWSLADIFEYRVDMSRDLQDGDEIRVLVERERGADGSASLGRVLAASLELSGATVDAIRFHSRGASGEYYDADGKSLRAPFLRAPLAFRRISSVFGARKHPILGIWRAHRGTDYAAASGTPVRSIGDGVVVFAGRKHGFGNVVEVRHRNDYVSRYGHLRAFAAGTRVGARTQIGRTIGYVGMTGLATAPHLHFEVLINGVQRDPRLALRTRGGDPIPRGERTRFARVRSALLASLEPPPAGDRSVRRD